MEITATQYHLRIAPRKVRLVARSLHGLPVREATFFLKTLRKASSTPLEKLLRSAIANAKENHKLSEEVLHIKQIIVNEGPTLKRFRPRAFGRSAPIRKRSSHITLILQSEEQVPKKAAKPEKKRAERKGEQHGS